MCLIQNPLSPHPGFNLLRFSDSWSQWITEEWWLICAGWKKGCSSSLLPCVTPVYSIYVTKQMRGGMRSNRIHRSSSKAHHATFYMFKFLNKTKNDQYILTLLVSPNFIVHQVLSRDAVSHLCVPLCWAPFSTHLLSLSPPSHLDCLSLQILVTPQWLLYNLIRV